MMNTNRRNFLSGSAAVAVGSALTPAMLAASSGNTRAAELMRRSLVINGNMLPAFNEDPADAEFLELVRSSGLTAVKYSLGGGEADFSSTVQHIGSIDGAIADHSEIYAKILTPSDILDAKRDGKVGIIYAFEDAGMLEGKVERINYFADLGVRSMQLSYNGVSPFASGVMAAKPSPGITDAGREAVVTMNNVGVTIDVSHSDDKSTLQIIERSSRPVMISHGGCAGILQHPRNKSDAVLKAVADQGGVFGLYELSYLTPGLEQQNLDDYMRHLTHAISVCGTDHVGIGSDALMLEFDTSPESMAGWNASIAARAEAGIAAPGEGPPPFVAELNGPQRSELIADGLLESGYSEDDAEKILGANFMHVFKETWRG